MKRIAFALLALLTVCPAVAAQEWRQARDYEVRLTNFDMSPGEIRLRAGEPVRLTLVNVSGSNHSFSADDFFAASQLRPRDAAAVQGGRLVVPAGQARTVVLVPGRGRYRAASGNLLYRLLGMRSRIIVE